jgi:hypothetical protein
MISLLDTKDDGHGSFYRYDKYIVQGWFTQSNIDWYRRAVAKIGWGTVVEIGVYGGASLLAIEDVCRVNRTSIIGYDLWELNTKWDAHWFQEHRARKDILDSILREYDLNHISLVKQDSALAAQNHADNSVDLAFVDAWHESPGVDNDIAAWWPKVKTVLAGHDYDSVNFPDVVHAVQKFAASIGQEVKVVDNIWWFVK